MFITKIKKIVPKGLKNFIRKTGMVFSDKYYLLPKSEITYAEDLLYTFHNTGSLYDPLFIESYNLGKKTDNNHLLKDYDIRWRIHVLCWAATQAKKLEGDFVDCGVSTGIFARAVINFIDFKNTDKTYYLLDTFGGLDPKFSSESEMKRNHILKYNEKTENYEQVKKTFSEFNTKIIKGSVPDTLSQVNTQKVCFLSIDMNCVEPEIAALNFFWDKMVSGGIIILDDYGYKGCDEQKKAHDDFAKSKNTMVLSLPTCQGIIIKQ